MTMKYGSWAVDPKNLTGEQLLEAYMVYETQRMEYFTVQNPWQYVLDVRDYSVDLKMELLSRLSKGRPV